MYPGVGVRFVWLFEGKNEMATRLTALVELTVEGASSGEVAEQAAFAMLSQAGVQVVRTGRPTKVSSPVCSVVGIRFEKSAKVYRGGVLRSCGDDLGVPDLREEPGTVME